MTKCIGRPRLDPQETPLDKLEAFCCGQVERIQARLNTRYTLDRTEDRNDSYTRMAQILPRNSGYLLYHQLDVENRGSIGMVGRRKPEADAQMARGRYAIR